MAVPRKVGKMEDRGGKEKDNPAFKGGVGWWGRDGTDARRKWPAFTRWQVRGKAKEEGGEGKRL